jgi:hypothetical protein
LVTIAACPAAALLWQSVTVASENAAVVVRAPAWHFIDGEPLARLKDGQSVRLELTWTRFTKPGAAAAVERRQAFVLSYDLWEERFAVALPEEPSRAVSHLTAPAAEAWCLRQLAVPVSALGSLGGSVPFWIRLEYRVANGNPSTRDDDGGFTLRGLIDLLSRRTRAGDAPRSIEAGPFRIQE